MKFFVPFCEDDPIKTEELYNSIKEFAFSIFKWEILDRQVHSLAYFNNARNSKNFTAEVGKASDDNGETVFAILETKDSFLICTPNSGVLRGNAMVVSKREVLGQSYFDQ